MGFFILLLLLVLPPMYICGKMCKARGWDVNKGQLLGLITGFLGVLILWLLPDPRKKAA